MSSFLDNLYVSSASTKISGTQYDTVPEIIVERAHTAEGIAYDWIHKNLYFTDAGAGFIVVADSVHRTHRRVLISEDLDQPRAIVVDPRDGQG